MCSPLNVVEGYQETGMSDQISNACNCSDIWDTKMKDLQSNIQKYMEKVFRDAHHDVMEQC